MFGRLIFSVGLCVLAFVFMATPAFAETSDKWVLVYREILEREIERGKYNYLTLEDMNTDGIPELILSEQRRWRHEKINSYGDFVYGKGNMAMYMFVDGKAELWYQYTSDSQNNHADHNAMFVILKDAKTKLRKYAVFTSYKSGVNLVETVQTFDGLHVSQFETKKGNYNNFFKENFKDYTIVSPVYHPLNAQTAALFKEGFNYRDSEALNMQYSNSLYTVNYPFNADAEERITGCDIVDYDNRYAIYVDVLDINGFPDFEALIAAEARYGFDFRDMDFRMASNGGREEVIAEGTYSHTGGRVMKGYARYVNHADLGLVYRIVGCVFEKDEHNMFGVAKKIVESVAINMN